MRSIRHSIHFDIGHPFHFHVFSKLVKCLNKSDRIILVTARDKDCNLILLEKSNIEYINRGHGGRTILTKSVYFLRVLFLFLRLKSKYHSKLLIGFSSPYLSFLSKITGTPFIAFDDTDNDTLTWCCYAPFAKSILTPVSFPHKRPHKQIRFNGCFELTYLHPKYFVPDSSILEKLNIKHKESYIIIRFVNHSSLHDHHVQHIGRSEKLRLLSTLMPFGRLFISSEEPLEEEFKPFGFSLNPDEMHQAMAFASFVIGESATMASEAAVLGVPAIFFDPVGRCYTREEEEKYGLVFRYDPTPDGVERGIKKAIDLLRDPNTKAIWQEKRKKFLEDSVDVQAFLIWFVENYPESARIMKENPDYQYNFR